MQNEEVIEQLKRGCEDAVKRANRLERELRLAKARAELAEADRDILLEENKSLQRSQRRLDKALEKVSGHLAEYHELIEEERYEE